MEFNAYLFRQFNFTRYNRYILEKHKYSGRISAFITPLIVSCVSVNFRNIIISGHGVIDVSLQVNFGAFVRCALRRCFKE